MQVPTIKLRLPCVDEKIQTLASRLSVRGLFTIASLCPERILEDCPDSDVTVEEVIDELVRVTLKRVDAEGASTLWQITDVGLAELI